jgi:predicted acylesterase/phospholipase RssA
MDFDSVAISGGGMRGVAMLGALTEFEKAGWLKEVTQYAGTSVGAVLAAALATRKDLDTVFDRHVQQFSYKSSVDLTGLDKHFGLDSGEGLKTWIDAVLGEPVTFAEVRARHGTNLKVCATNLNARKAEIFSPETHPDMDVAEALRLSCSVPVYFAAKKYNGALYVDGALTNNFPVDLVDGKALGIRVQSHPKPPGTAWTLDGYVGAIVESVTNREIPPCVDAVVLELELGNDVQPLNFKMGVARTRQLFDTGKTQAKRFIVSYTKKHT